MSILASTSQTGRDTCSPDAGAGWHPYTKTAHDLLMGTAAQESLMCTHLVQQSGPGIGPYMATPLRGRRRCR
jgi:hypothetical protein